MKKLMCIVMICVFVLVPVLTLSVSAEVPYGNMIALYNMESELKDSISGGSGTLWNGASFVGDSSRGSVLYLNNDGVTAPGEGEGYSKEGQWAELAAPHIPNSDAMTISIWFKVKEMRTWARAVDIGDAKAQNALANGETATVGPDRFINISPSNGEYTIGTFNENDSSEGIPNNRDRVFADLVAENEWVHAVLVIDATSGKPNVLYINGKAYESTHANAGDDPEPAEFSPKDILESPESVRNVFLGRSAYENNGDQIFNGYIDDVAIFDTALTAEQVAELMTADLSKGDPSKVAEIAAVATAADNSTPAAADVPATAQTLTASVAPQTGDSASIMFILMAISVLGSGVYFKVKKTRI